MDYEGLIYLGFNEKGLFMNNVLDLQQRFRRNIYKYVNGDFLSWKDALLSTISPSVPFYRHAKRIFHQYMKSYSFSSRGLSPDIVTIDAYQGKNPHVLRMMDFICDLKEDLVGAYLHGSLGTYEETPFSDFDALVILRNEIFKDPERLSRTAYKIYCAQSIMFDFDPIQHHGWVVLSEADLESYPQDRFPKELFHYAKSLFPNHGRSLSISCKNSAQNVRQSFDNLCQSASKRIEQRESIRNVYELKILLSQFMLLPSLYVEMRDGKGIYKKFSFEAARVDFETKDWSIMDDVSSIRANWSYHISPSFHRLISKPTKHSRLLAKKFSPPVPKEIQRFLTDDFYQRMSRLITLMASKPR